ncbi:MAG: GTPase [Salegentibacter sp.]
MDRLIFIYNAESGKANAFLDAAHKILEPSTYSCDLCSLTYGKFSEKKEWKRFRRNSPVPMEFLHKDKFLKAYASKFGYKFTFPAILASENGDLQMLISAEKLGEMKELEELIAALKTFF